MIEYIIISKICLFSVKHEILLVNEINIFKNHYRYMKAYHDYGALEEWRKENIDLSSKIC